jgi:hypothetical protein
MPAILTQRPVRAAGTLDQLLKDGSIILFRADRQEMMVLNPLAALIWDSSTGEQSIEAMVGEIRELFPEQVRIEADVLACVEDLVAKGFLALHETATAQG